MSATSESIERGIACFMSKSPERAETRPTKWFVAKLWEYRTKPLFERFERNARRPRTSGQTAAEHQNILEAVAARCDSRWERR